MKLDSHNHTFSDDDSEFEMQLRQFRPESPRALPAQRAKAKTMRRVWISVAGVAAALLLFFGLFGSKLRVRDHRAQEISASVPGAGTLGQLRRFTDDPAQLDSQLSSLAQTLPDVHRKNGVLEKLADEIH